MPTRQNWLLGDVFSCNQTSHHPFDFIDCRYKPLGAPTTWRKQYLRQPLVFHETKQPHYIWQFLRSIYRLKHSPHIGFHQLRDYLILLGFKEGILNHWSLFVFINDGIANYFLVYIDDIVITSSSLEFITKVIQYLWKEFLIRDLGSLRYFLGIHVSRVVWYFSNSTPIHSKFITWRKLCKSQVYDNPNRT